MNGTEIDKIVVNFIVIVFMRPVKFPEIGLLGKIFEHLPVTFNRILTDAIGAYLLCWKRIYIGCDQVRSVEFEPVRISGQQNIIDNALGSILSMSEMAGCVL